jgi:hypothetical protein
MTHLAPGDVVDALDGRLGAERAAHLEQCPACTAIVEELRATRAEVARVDVPEPSPLFWDHLTRRIQEAIAEEPPPRPAWWHEWRPRWALAASGFVAVAGLTAYLSLPRPSQSGGPEVTSDAAVVEPAPAAASLVAVDAEAEWTLVVDLADDLTLDEALETGWVDAASADTLVEELTADERRELARLLEDGVRQPKS